MSNDGILQNEHGATITFVAVVLAVLLSFSALAVDVGYLYGVRNELHNAADAGSLAGARVLFNDDGILNREAAIFEATRIATANKTGNQAVAAEAVETGHWSFASQTFTASENTTQLEGWQEMSSGDLDGNPAFINAVRVQTQRSDTPSFFAKIIELDSFLVNNDAVAWLGFSGQLYPGELDQPMAICKESIIDPDGSYSCNMGRMLNSGGSSTTSNTGGWTNFSQPCGTANAAEMKELVCSNGNTGELELGQEMGATGGVQNSTLDKLSDCWAAATGKIKNWNLTLAVVECPGNNVGNCAKLVGAVNVDVIWIVEKNDPLYNNVPWEMTIFDKDNMQVDYWADDEPDGFTRWKSFVDHFKLANVNGPPVSDADYATMYQNKNIFFLPSCEEHELTGNSGGENFGIMAAIPKLVE